MNKYQESLEWIGKQTFQLRERIVKISETYSFENLQELVDRATPMKPITDLGNAMNQAKELCPKCQNIVFDGVGVIDKARYSYCPNYGQALKGKII